MILLDYSKEELKNILSGGFRAGQVFDWLIKGFSFDEMSNVSKEYRNELKEKYIDQPVKIHKTYISKIDGTEKYLFKLYDGNIIEGVLMKYNYGNTLCVSTQIGCRMGCKFCASTLNGLVRDLTPGEILGQIIAVNHKLGEGRNITNVVLMGSGEPLDNFDNVVKFINLLTHKDGLNFSRRNISLSTCGLIDKIKEMADLDLGVTLTISLHSPFDENRKEIMPIANKYSIREIMSAANYYFKKTGRRVIFEYALIDGVNNSDKDIDELTKLLKGFPTHLNLIVLNEVKERNLKGINRKLANEFAKKLEDKGVSVTLRRTMGSDIEGACGQLRNSYIKGDNE